MAGFCVSGFKILPPNPPAPAPPGLPTTIVIGGTVASGATPNPAVPSIPTGLSVGDQIVAFLMRENPPSGYSASGHLPAGFSLVREDNNPAVGSSHEPIYTAIAIRIATLADTTPGTYSFDNSQAGSNGYLYVGVAGAHQSQGIDNISYSMLNVSADGEITASGVLCAQSNELVFVVGLSNIGYYTSTLALAIPLNSQAVSGFYQAGPIGGNFSIAQTLTNNITGQALSAYQVAMKLG